jgi:hypothetical protein
MNLFNPIISRNFMYSNLKYTEKGLFYVNKSDNNRDDIFITDDQTVILSLLDLNADEVESATKAEFFEMISKNRKFRISKFYDAKEKTSDLIKEFANYLTNCVDTYPTFSPVNFSDFATINPNFYDLLKESISWLTETKDAKKKFSGLTVKKYNPDYDMTKLATTIPMFMKSFPSKRDYELFLIKTDEEAIHQHFMYVTEGVTEDLNA